ncbi:uncharacterized protein E0L32_004853 [Thyridium curvatum]|uniref:Methyltransferase n=1 Tax=Thyridium curvatum TaxID=1093900 RepID=A0A507B5C8_9PEZI|nr:uncharacterized protein E0L32_004853 [Thyridium curvatum]TPX15023.1 hypothetical protein E0L32_004853 [Thyridium curvatum]
MVQQDEGMVLEADDEMSLLSSTASLRSSILSTRDENGRQYHGYKDGKYVLPIDQAYDMVVTLANAFAQEELYRQEYQYNLCLNTFGGYSFAPLNTVHRVLDVGCGLGFWACEFTEKHPEAEIIGVDLSPIQPQYIPQNVQFEIDDLEEPWTFTFKFDYIHSLMMTGAFRDWPAFYRQAYENLNQDGWLEIQDIDFPLVCDDGTLPDDSPMKRWSDLMLEAGERSGFHLNTCGKAAEMMKDAGFVDIVRIPFKWPMNRWPKDPRAKQIGGWVLENFTLGVETICLALFTRFMGWTKEQVVEFADSVRADFQDHNKHTYFNLYVTYGRKP